MLLGIGLINSKSNIQKMTNDSIFINIYTYMYME